MPTILSPQAAESQERDLWAQHEERRARGLLSDRPIELYSIGKKLFSKCKLGHNCQDSKKRSRGEKCLPDAPSENYPLPHLCMHSSLFVVSSPMPNHTLIESMLFTYLFLSSTSLQAQKAVAAAVASPRKCCPRGPQCSISKLVKKYSEE